MTPGPLLHEPYDVFRSSITPAALYARQKWLGESSTAKWQADFAAAVAELYQGQSADGLWQGSPVETIHRLFGLHLTVRRLDPRIGNGLDALVRIVSDAKANKCSDGVPAARLRGLPFTQGSRQGLILPATLFLCAIFGRANDPAVLALYHRMTDGLNAITLRREKPSSIHNLLRALVVHPQYFAAQATHCVVAWLADRQTRQGAWGPEIPFYQALNALAHLDTPAANQQTEVAFKHLLATQHADGTWGESDPQWCTFLAVHALRNKGIE